jgi:hypothetical protein
MLFNLYTISRPQCSRSKPTENQNEMGLVL